MLSGHLGLLRDPPLCFLIKLICIREREKAAEGTTHSSNVCISQTTWVRVPCCIFMWQRDSGFHVKLRAAVEETWSVHSHAAAVIVAFLACIFLLPSAHLSAQTGQRISPRCSEFQTDALKTAVHSHTSVFAQ